MTTTYIYIAGTLRKSKGDKAKEKKTLKERGGKGGRKGREKEGEGENEKERNEFYVHDGLMIEKG